MQLSAYLKDELLNHLLRNDQMVSPSVVYLALFTSDPTEDATGIEVSGGSYSRQTITFASPASGISLSSAQVTFPVATFTWGEITHGAIFDSQAGGNMLFFAEFPSPKTIQATDQLVLGSGNISVGFI